MGFKKMRAAQGPSLAQRDAEAAKKNAAQRRADTRRVGAEQRQRGMGYTGLTTSKYEREAGVTPPGFEGFRNRDTRELLSEFKINPFTGEASQKLRAEALGTGPSELANLQLQRQGAEEAKMRSNIGLKSQAEQSNAMSNLMRTGGLGGGARTSLARSGMRDALMAKQGVASDGVMSRFGINESDMQRRQQLLGQTADVERQADMANIDTLKGDVQRRTEFDGNRYKELMGAWGAEQTANATRAAGQQKSGKCFAGSTKILMSDKSELPISEIKVGDIVFFGGKVISTHRFEDPNILYNYMGSELTGSHAVYEDEKWLRVRDSKRAIKTDKLVSTVFNLVTEHHIIVSHGMMFSDNMETDLDFADEKKSLADLNGVVCE